MTATGIADGLRLKIEKKGQIADDVVQLVLRDPGGGTVPKWNAGAHIDLVLPGHGARQYSLCGDIRDRTSFTICVLRDPAGRGGSRHVHDNLSEGDLVLVGGPRNHFVLEPSPRYTFIAGGIGITPILPMIHQASRSGSDWRLHYGGRKRTSMAFAADLQRRYPEAVALYPQDETGQLDIPGLLPAPGHPDERRIYCCGPEGLLAAVERQCSAWSTSRLHVERFAANSGTPDRPGTAFEVELSCSGRVLAVPADRTILEVVREAGIPVPSSCGGGICGTCETPVLAGVPEHRDAILSEDERSENQSMMICCSRSSSPRLVLDL